MCFTRLHIPVLDIDNVTRYNKSALAMNDTSHTVMDTQTQNSDTEISRTDGYQDELIDGVRSARDHKVAAVNFRTMLVDKWASGIVIEEKEFEIEYKDDRTVVRWQGGPFEWAKDVMGGSTVGSTEFMRHRESDVFPDVFIDNPHVEAFCKSGTAIEFLDA